MKKCSEIWCVEVYCGQGRSGFDGDYTVEATALNREAVVDFDMLNKCFADIRELTKK